MSDGIMQVEENRDEINEAVPSDGEYEQEPSSVRHEGSEDEGEDLMDNMEAYVCLIDVVAIVCIAECYLVPKLGRPWVLHQQNDEKGQV
jgi:hypothetical protein